MLASQLIQTTYPTLTLANTVAFALQLMDDYDIQHLPVIANDLYIGLISKSDLLDELETNTINVLLSQLQNISVKSDEHLLTVLKKMANHRISLLPVINTSIEMMGCIDKQELTQQLDSYLGNHEIGAIVVLEIERRNYSFGEISRLIETNDAYITQLNTYTEAETGLVIVTIKINKVEISDILATFQRYEYNIRYYFGEEQFANEIQQNYNHLISYLNI